MADGGNSNAPRYRSKRAPIVLTREQLRLLAHMDAGPEQPQMPQLPDAPLDRRVRAQARAERSTTDTSSALWQRFDTATRTYEITLKARPRLAAPLKKYHDAAREAINGGDAAGAVGALDHLDRVLATRRGEEDALLMQEMPTLRGAAKTGPAPGQVLSAQAEPVLQDAPKTGPVAGASLGVQATPFLEKVPKTGPVHGAPITAAATLRAPDRPARPLPQRAVPVSVAGQQLMQARAVSSLQATGEIAAAAARKAFAKGSARAAQEQVSVKPEAGRGRALAKHSAKIAAKSEAYIAAGTNDTNKELRRVAMQKESVTAARLQSALENVEAAGKAGPSLEDLDVLDLVCGSAVELFSKRLEGDLKRIERFISTQTGPVLKSLEAQRKELLEGPELQRLASVADLALETKLRKSAGVAAELTEAMATLESARSEANAAKVRDLARRYADLFLDHEDAYKKWPSLKRPSGIVGKQRFASDMLQQAELVLFSLKANRLGSPPWPADQTAEAADLQDKGRELKAIDVLQQGKSFLAGTGTSDVLVLKNKKGTVEFAFKSAKGESSDMGMPKGSGAIREAISSKVCEAVLEQTGLDFGFPKSTIAVVEGKAGALIEGISGREIPAADEIKPGSKEANEIQAFQNKVPGKELQKVVMCGIATGNIFDLKWNNIFWEGEGADAKARPFDAGASFLPAEEIKTMIHKPGEGQGKITCQLLKDANDQIVSGALLPMDAELVEAILQIDTTALSAAIGSERDRHQATGLDKFLADEHVRNGLSCLEQAKRILRRRKDDPPTLVEFFEEFGPAIANAFPE